MADVKKGNELDMVELGGMSAVGGLWFDTALAKLKFAGTCCQQVAGCCQRVSNKMPLPVEELVKTLKG